jgi:uncharacterized repeat protein (TIGR04076 family)
MMNKCKITVLKKMYNPDLAEEYGQPEIHREPCPHCTEGQEFIAMNALDRPEGLCGWAWNDMEKILMAAGLGGSFDPWMINGYNFITCCTYALEPVVFRVDRIERETGEGSV